MRKRCWRQAQAIEMVRPVAQSVKSSISESSPIHDKPCRYGRQAALHRIPSTDLTFSSSFGDRAATGPGMFDDWEPSLGKPIVRQLLLGPDPNCSECLASAHTLTPTTNLQQAVARVNCVGHQPSIIDRCPLYDHTLFGRPPVFVCRRPDSLLPLGSSPA
jgi:hypothetical protein